MFPVLFDVETKSTFRHFADPQDLGVSVAVLFDYAHNVYHRFFEQDINNIFPFFENASYVIGYNIIGFDLPVLQRYYHGNILELPCLDMLETVRQRIGKRVGLNDLAASTLGIKKSGHGLQAVEWYASGEFEKLAQYCEDDVKVTKRLFDFGCQNGYVLLQGSTIRVDWRRYLQSTTHTEVSQTLPF